MQKCPSQFNSAEEQITVSAGKKGKLCFVSEASLMEGAHEITFKGYMTFQSHGYKYLGTAHLKQRKRNLLLFDQSTKRQAKSIWHCHPIEDPAEDAVDVSMTGRSTDQQRPHLLPSNGHYTQ